MRIMAAVCVSLLFLGTPPAGNPRAEQQGNANECQFLKQVLNDYQHVRIGSTRRDVERYFTLGGGGQFPSKARYVHPKCNYLHVEVGFELLKPEEGSSPEDKVVEVSRLYVEYPAKD